MRLGQERPIVIQDHPPCRRPGVRNLVIFTLAALGSGWFGYGLDQVLGLPPSQGPGMLLWLVLPALTGLALRAFGGDGWSDAGFSINFGAHRASYALALALNPLAIALVAGVGVLLGWVSFGDHSSLGAIGPMIGVALAPTLLKNLFEEFAWRGYLTPRLRALGVPDLWGNAVVAVVWFAWHLPYYLFFLDRAALARYTHLDLLPFLALGFIGIVPLTVVYGELRLATGSVWPTLVLHTIGNVLVPGLILHGVIRLSPEGSLWVAPGPESVAMILLFASVGGWMLWRRRVR